MARKSKTLTLPDESFQGPPAIAEIEDLAEEYAAKRDERMEALTEEKKLKTRLVGMMEFHNLTEYNRDGILITFEIDKKLKVKIKGDSVSEDDEDGDGEE